jgi:hypothetical protein
LTSAGFEIVNPVIEKQQTYAFDRTGGEIGLLLKETG